MRQLTKVQVVVVVVIVVVIHTSLDWPEHQILSLQHRHSKAAADYSTVAMVLLSRIQTQPTNSRRFCLRILAI